MIRVLHIDQSPADRELILDLLGKDSDGFRVAHAGSRKELDSCLTNGDFDVVLADLDILGFNGLEIKELIAEKHPDVPVIIVTGAGKKSTAVDAMRRGAADFVIKWPSHLQRLPHAIRAAVDNVRLQSGHARDVSARRKAERDLQEAQSYLEHIADISPGLQLVADARTARVLQCSNGVAQMLGLSAEEFISKPFLERIHPDDRQATAANIERTLTGESVSMFENRCQCKDGSYRWLSWQATSADENGIVHAVAADITAHKRVVSELEVHRVHLQELVAQRTEQLNARVVEAEQLNSAMVNIMEDLQASNRTLESFDRSLQARNKELDAFAYSVSHDLRAPLRHITGFVDLLQESSADSLDSTGREYLDTIAESARRMDTLIEALLEFSRAGRTEMNKRDLDLHALAEEVVKEMRSETMGRRIEWIVGRLPQAYGDRTTLRQVLVNLVDNAMKYTREEQHARIEIGTVSGEEGEVVVFVRDNGAGFDMRYAHNLFGVFQRLHHAERFEGTGVGLASVRQTVHRHHGHVWAEGKVDEGATFYFSLPVAGLSEPEYH